MNLEKYVEWMLAITLTIGVGAMAVFAAGGAFAFIRYLILH